MVMKRRQLFKKLAGIAGAMVAAPVMAKEIAEQTSATGIIKFPLSNIELYTNGFSYSSFPGGSASLGDMAIKDSDLIDFEKVDKQIELLESKVKARGFLIERKKFVEFPANPVEGQMFYGPDGNLWVFDGPWWKVLSQYDTLDGQHGAYYTSTL
jgi:hypothetical protein